MEFLGLTEIIRSELVRIEGFLSNARDNIGRRRRFATGKKYMLNKTSHVVIVELDELGFVTTVLYGNGRN